MKDRIILIDADVVSHFITGGEILSLGKIFKTPIFMLDKVYAEIVRFPKKQALVENLVNYGIIKLMDFPENDQEVKKEYSHIKKVMLRGDGESACMAVAKFSKHILASSNLSDTKRYCNMHAIDYLTTMDFLCKALCSGLFDLERCNSFITAVLNAKSRLPVKNMKEFECREVTFCD